MCIRDRGKVVRPEQRTISSTDSHGNTFEIPQKFSEYLWDDPTLTLHLYEVSFTAFEPEWFATHSNHLRDTLSSTEGSWLTYQRNPESEGLVLPLWSLTLISCPVTSAVYVGTLSHWSVSLSRTHMTSILCRWLGGSVQRIHTPYFYLVNFSCLSPIFSLKGKRLMVINVSTHL